MICNSTPLICLAKIGKLELLKKLFGSVIIPEEVENEVLIEGKEGYDMIKQAIEEGLIKVHAIKKRLEFGLGKGENAAISLAHELKDKLIMDDAHAVRAARVLGVEVFRTTSIVLMCIKKKIFDKKECLNVMNKLIEIGYYISPRVYVKLVEGLK
jgi:predicted nucleic acid-binding protein